MIRQCKYCDKIFDTKISGQIKYCSKKCRIKAKNIKASQNQTFKCDYCKKEYLANKRKLKNKAHHFCCEEHSKLWRKAHEKQANHICMVCGKPFYTSHARIKTCSQKCGNILATQTRANFSIEKELQRKQKEYITKKKNNSFNTSKDEDYIYKCLYSKFKSVKRQYKSKKYPFHCDFYIPELDLYIEYQGDWSHGKYKRKIFGSFNKTLNEHLDLLNLWKSKAKPRNRYEQAVNVWTKRDPLKRQIAKENKLNWIEFFTIEEFENWFKNLP